MHLKEFSCAPILQFSLLHQMAPWQSTKFRTACFRHFCTVLRKDSVANYRSIWTQFPPSVGGLDVLYKALNFYSYVDRWRHKICKFAMEIFQNVKIRLQRLCQILCMVTIEIQSHCTALCLTSCQYCFAFEVMLLVSSLYYAFLLQPTAWL